MLTDSRRPNDRADGDAVRLAANALFGWWWADIAAALAMVPWIVRAGVEGLRGETCGDEGSG